MLSLQKICMLLALLFAANVNAAPSEGRGPNPYKKALPGQPWASCTVKDRFVYDSYVLKGRNWNVTQDQVKDAIKSYGKAVTAWDYTHAIQNGVHVFEAKFQLPIGMDGRVSKNAAKLIKPWPLKLRCVKRHNHGANAPYGINNPPPSDDFEVIEVIDDIKDGKDAGLGERL